MGFDVTIAGNVAVLAVSETGRYTSELDAVMAIMRAAHDINLTAIVYGDATCRLLDEFTGGLRKNSAVVKELLGITVKDDSLFSRLKKWLLELYSTQMADQKHIESNDEGHVRDQEQSWVGRSLSLSTRNHFHSFRTGIRPGGNHRRH